MAEQFPERLQPGSGLNFHNNYQEGAIVIRLKMEDGTEVAATLHPGAELNVTVGTGNVDAYIDDVGTGDE